METFSVLCPAFETLAMQALDGTSEKGLIDPLKSKINFAVPSKNGNSDSNSFLPGIHEEAVKAIATFSNQKPQKLSVDGQKISWGKCINIGDYFI
jgi:hypothetical protein